jgi:hypothetical protein
LNLARQMDILKMVLRRPQSASAGARDKCFLQYKVGKKSGSSIQVGASSLLWRNAEESDSSNMHKYISCENRCRYRTCTMKTTKLLLIQTRWMKNREKLSRHHGIGIIFVTISSFIDVLVLKLYQVLC